MIATEATAHRRSRRSRRLARLLSGVDLVIDFATLGEYGLEFAPLPAEAPCRTRRPTSSAWEALPDTRARRGGCGHERVAPARRRGFA